jgi:MinD-like ATPase involved in chromosome partitioning or flagellar assembly
MVLTPPQGNAALLRSQADALRAGRDVRAIAGGAGGAVPTLLCASGRGGSGTTLLAALLAASAAGDGYRVLLVDGDDLLGPLAMAFGVTPRASWMDLRGGRATPMDVATPITATLTLVAGGAARLTEDATPITAAERRACLKRVSALADGMDLVVVDCGARLDAVLGAVAPHAGERVLAVSAGHDPIALASTYALIKALRTRHGALRTDVLVNRHEGRDATRCFEAIDAGARQFLEIALHQAGAIPADPTLDAALRAGMPFLDAAAGSPAAQAAHDVVMQVLPARPLSRSGA